MDEQAWQRLKETFFEALDKAPEERLRIVESACAGDPVLRLEIEGLLRAVDGLEPSRARSPPADAIAGEDEPGAAIDRYRIVQRIGEGGFGVVYAAEQQAPVRRTVALKILKPGMATKEILARFETERQALACMDHPSIARVFDGGVTASGRPYFVMELVRGIAIDRYCDQCRLPIRDRLLLFVEVCRAVQHAHQKGIIHRDLKPSNVLVSIHEGHALPKVIDFGVAKALGQRLTAETFHTQFAQMIGTPQYMSPEQAEMSPLDVDTRCDVYSLGVLLYELVTGTTPLDRARLQQVAFDELRRIIREEDPAPPSSRLGTLDGPTTREVAEQRRTDGQRLIRAVRGDLDWIVMKCLEKDRTRRYETAHDLVLDLGRHLTHQPVSARPPSLTYRMGKFVRRHRGLVAASCAMLLLGVAALVADNVRVAHEQRKTQTALDRAQANLGLARGAVDKFLAEAGLAEMKEQPLPPAARSELLKAARGFYETYLDDPGSFRNRAILHHALHEYAEALALFDRVLATRPADAAALVGRGHMLWHVGRGDEALAALDRAIAIEPDHADAHDLRGSVLRTLGRPGEALPAHERAVALVPNVARYHINRGNALHYSLARSEEALPEYDRALTLDPDDASACRGRGDALLALGRFEESLAAHDRAIQLESDAGPASALAHNGRGNALSSLGRFSEALAAHDRALELDQGLAWAHTGRGNALSGLGRLEEAVHAHTEALRIQPDLAEAHCGLGSALLGKGDPEGAIREYREAIRISDNVVAHCNLGIILWRQGDRDGAIREYREAIRIRGSFAEARYCLGVVLAQSGDPEGAIRELEEAIRIRPDYAEVYVFLGTVLMGQGRFQEALPWLRKGDELGSKRSNWAEPSKERIRLAERQLELERSLDRVRSGEVEPRDAAERIDLAGLFHAKTFYAEAARMYAEAFAEAPSLAEDLGTGHRYNAACCAALAAARQQPDAAESRRRALGWLRADLAARARTPAGLAATLEHWKRDPDLASVRDRLEGLTAEERHEWTRLWTDVDARIAEVRGDR